MKHHRIPEYHFGRMVFSTISCNIINTLIESLHFGVCITDPGKCYCCRARTILYRILKIEFLIRISEIDRQIGSRLPNTVLPVIPAIVVINKYTQLTCILPTLPKSHHRNLLPCRVSSERQQTIYHFFVNLFYPSFTCPMRIFLAITGIKRLFNRYSVSNGHIFLTIPISIFMSRMEVGPLHIYKNSVLFFYSTHLFIEDNKRIALYHLNRSPILGSSLQTVKYQTLGKQLSTLFYGSLYGHYFLMTGVQPVTTGSSFSL